MRRRYGAGPGHLLLLLACFAFTGYVLTRIHAQGGMIRIGAWFVASLVVHDLIAWPLYALADRYALRIAGTPRVPWINHVRVPAIISGTLLAISFPLVLGLSATAYRNLTGQSEAPYLLNWLLVTAVLFGVSALIYAVRLVVATTKSSPLDGRRPSVRPAK